ncbi:UvrD-helicase domain-containing protein [Parvicella tangerina]|uniref:DNA 3'-5' helicase n=1 Tax=Parvicella tangerina TaxID=2829795 RepID=A0A916NG99_9FLAO|nr:UvrD-helicase domain-containing protein [Parvicella tangerina]CAG5079379.1 RecBCD enzyme subunit RecB [Parvicella tangerina]
MERNLETKQPSLKIYKSSAGSGKTYQLVLNYLSLILKAKNPDKFRRILAITFTNKASKEMKERVLQGLKKLKKGEDTSFIEDYVRSTGLSPMELAEKSDSLLTNILHHYGHLNILTIDKFVHRIIRSFSRELGLTTNFELTFDFDGITARCIDEVLQELGNDEQLTRILIEYYQQLIDLEDQPNIEYALNERAKILGKEESVEKLEFYKDKDLSFFVDVRKEIKDKIKSLRTASIGNSVKIQSILGEYLSELKFGNSKYTKILNGIDDYNKVPDVLSETQINNIKEGKWISKKAEKELPELVNIINTNDHKLQQLFLQTNTNINQEIFLRNIDKNLLSFALLNDVQRQIEKLKKDNNILLIGELNQIISDIISKESAPYIYEKIGARFENYFIDEFQDTSTLQWQNLIPLIHDSLASGNESLIVGDAKQSIYRWRGGNAQQFIDLPNVSFNTPESAVINQSFQNSHEGYVLEDNYRSAKAVIQFNNWLFPKMMSSLESSLLHNTYTDIQQHPKREEIGYVEVSIKKSKTDYNTDHPYDKDLLNQIDSCLKDGYSFRDLCILVRRNSEGTELAAYLKENDLPVSSQESLLLSDSNDVKLILAFLKALSRPTDENVLSVFSYYDQKGLFRLFQKYRIPAAENNFFSKGYKFDEFLSQEIPMFEKSFFTTLSIFDQVDYLLRTLEISREDLYVDRLLNATYDFQQKNGQQTNRFIDYFEEKILNSSVVPPENTNAITIMTIHKSKGLQFPVVFIPRRIDNSSNDSLWLSSELISDLGLNEINMNPGKNIPDENIQKTKNDNEELTTLDLINLIYVAYTRAENRLYIHLEENRASSLVKNQINLIESHENYDSSENKLAIGTPTRYHSKTGDSYSQVLHLSTKKTKTWRNTLILATPNHEEKEGDTYSERSWGMIIHELLQDIDVLKDAPKTFDQFIKKHKEWQPRRSSIETILESYTKSSKIQSLFQGTLEVMSERSIAASHGEILRPDKVLIKENEIIVLDFKTGSESAQHRQQILKYGHVLEHIYQKPIKLYLIYLSIDKISIIHV